MAGLKVAAVLAASGFPTKPAETVLGTRGVVEERSYCCSRSPFAPGDITGEQGLLLVLSRNPLSSAGLGRVDRGVARSGCYSWFFFPVPKAVTEPRSPKGL